MHNLRHLGASLALLLSLVGLARAADLIKIDRAIGKEPKYQSTPNYCLLVFGPEAKHKAWLVLDGDTLYVDRQGTGDLTQPECRVPAEAETRLYKRFFRVGDLTLGGKRYADLQVALDAAKDWGSAEETPALKELLAANPEASLFGVSIDVPCDKPCRDPRDGSAIKVIRHYATQRDDRGFLQFSPRRETAPVIHFGGPWTIWPDGPQKLIRGRNEELVLCVGTPGNGPGTFARICYDNLIPATAKPQLAIDFPVAIGQKPLRQAFTLEDRC